MKIWTGRLATILLILFIGLSCGCAKTNVDSNAMPPGAQAPGDGTGLSDSELEAKNLAESQRIIVGEKVYFPFDSSTITPQGQEILRRKSEVMKSKPNLRVLIEGNCDERGTVEYNLALGERRALAAKKYLILLGVNPMQIETVSFGEERPDVLGHNEEAWAMNRRDEFRLVW